MGVEDTENQQNQTADISPQLKLVVNERVAVIIKVVQKEVMQMVLHDVIKSVSLENTNPFYPNTKSGLRSCMPTPKTARSISKSVRRWWVPCVTIC